MDIKGEASIFKAELAKNLKQLCENAEIVIGKKAENNTTEIKVEDKSTHLTVNLNLILTDPHLSPEQLQIIAGRIKEVIGIQSNEIKASGDSTFEPFIKEGIGVITATGGTAGGALLQNANYIFTGEPKPKPVTVSDRGTLFISVNVVPPKVITE